MNIRSTLLALAVTFALPLSAQAGGPVIVEDTTVEAAPTEDGRLPPWLIPVGIVAVAIILAGGGSTCNGGDQTPEPPKGGC